MSVPAVAEPANPVQGTDASSTGQPGATSAQETRVDPTQVSSAESQEQPTRGPDFFRLAFQQIRGQQTQNAAPQPAAASPTPQAPSASGSPVPESERSAASPSVPTTQLAPATTLPPASPAGGAQQAPRTGPITTPDGRLILTKEELARQAQSEADRIIAKRQRDEQAKQERDQEVELRRTNPFEYARLMENRDLQLQSTQADNERLTGVISQQLHQYDRNVLDIFVSAVPEPERAKVIAKTEGIPGRKETAAATLKALRATWTAEGRASAKAELMKDPLFVKEVLARFGGQNPEPESNPVQVRPSSTSGQPQDSNQAVNSWMRSAAGSARQQTGRG